MFNSIRGENSNVEILPLITGTPSDFEDIIFRRGEDEWNARVGADYEFPFWDGSLKLIGNHRSEHSPILSIRREFVDDIIVEEVTNDNVEDEGETIARAEYSWKTDRGSDLQLSAEGAFNFLEEDQTLSTLTQINDTISNRVEERRAEATLAYGRALTPKFDLQSSIGVEYSELTESSSERLDETVRDFIRPKGFVSGAYKWDDSFTIRTRIEREVGQLDFGDFISVNDLQDGQDTSDAVDLVPEQSWLGNIEFEKRYGEDINFIANFYGALVSDTVDFTVTEDGNIAVGNLDSQATRYGIEFVAAGKLDRFGLNGVQADFELNVEENNIEDPVTLEDRRLSGTQIYYWRVNYRHDIPSTQWAYGGFISLGDTSPTFRPDNITSDVEIRPRTSIFIEHKDIFGLKARATLLNLVNNFDDFERQEFTDFRNIGVIETIEENELRSGLFFRLAISGTF